MLTARHEQDNGVQPTPDGSARIRAESLTVTLGGRAVVADITLPVRPGEVLGLIGPNGSGKTTLLRALAGLLKPSYGEVWLGDRPVSTVSPAERARLVAYMPQSAARHPFTGLETVLMGRYPHLGRFEVEGARDREAALSAMRRTETSDFVDRQLDTLSGGERQRVLLARALAQGAQVLLLDEPTSALDLKHRLLTMTTVCEEAAQRGAAVVAALHDLSIAGRYCHSLALMSHGRVASAGPPQAVLTPANLREAFGVETIVEPDPVTGTPHVTLLGESGRNGAAAWRGVRVHVICGAGSGRDLMHQLTAAGYTVTTCVLGQGDTDREAAQHLRVEFVPAPPFSAVSPEEHQRHIELVRAADYVALCDMAVGRNNLLNLEAALEARRLLVVDGKPFKELDYTGGEASRVFAELSVRGERVDRANVLRLLARHT